MAGGEWNERIEMSYTEEGMGSSPTPHPLRTVF